MYDQKLQYGSGCAIDSPMEPQPVPGAVANVAYEQSNTLGLLEDLYARLTSVLRHEPPSNAKCEAAGQLSHSELHGRVVELVSRQTSINASLRSLLERLTV